MMENVPKEAITAEMQRVFGADTRRINHALDVLSFAERILLKETADRGVVVPAALLHDIGIHEAERKYNSTAAVYQQIEGPPIAKGILTELGMQPHLVSEVCDIIAHHHAPRADESSNFKVLYDADLIVNLRDDFSHLSQSRLKEKIDRMFFTEAGRRLAAEILLK